MASDLLGDVPAQEFDIVVANMLAEVLKVLIQPLIAFCVLVVSSVVSIYEDKAQTIIAKLRKRLCT